ncbi:hypothetical protein ABEB36_012881 [Hypothenemus hampei]|uniref:Uncharacterized protein n=1 Tax=Hypothenemus hampei TaxID=57062 RepID=A0ABD1E6Z4_HYPHA
MSWASLEAFDELLVVVRGLILAEPGISLAGLEAKFSVICTNDPLLGSLGFGSLSQLMELSPSLLVYEGRCYVAGVDEDSDSDGEGEYFAP